MTGATNIMSVPIRTSDEIQKMRTAGALAAGVLDMIGEHVQVGVTTERLDKICHDYIVNTIHCIPAPLNYTSGPGQTPFPKSICTSVNHVICHGIPTEKKTLKDGDVLNIDVTVIKDGYHGDTSKMFFVGKSSVIAERLVRVTQECMYLGIKAAKPGNDLSEIGKVIQKHAHANRFSVVQEFCGHGIGDVFHDEPQVLHYANSAPKLTLAKGMTFTIEPMINAGRRHMKILPDGWTAVTKDHKMSAQWEHTILITDEFPEVLTKREDEILPWLS